MNNNLGDVKDATFNSLFNRALAKGSENGTFARPKGMFAQRSIQHGMFHMSEGWESPPSHLDMCLIPSLYRLHHLAVHVR